MSPKKEEGGEAPHAPFLCHGWCLYCGHMQAQGRLFELQPPPPPPAPLCTLFGIAFPFLLNRIAVLFTMKPGHLIHQMENLLGCPWTWFGDDQGKKKKRKGEKTPRLLSVGFSAAVAESIAVYLNKGFLLDLERWKADISLHFGKPRHAHGIIVKYNLGCTLQRGLLQLWCTSETNLFSWSLSLWRGCKCYLSFSIKNTAGCAICLAQPSLFFPDAFLCRSFYVAICTNFLYLDFGKHFCLLFFK